MVTGTVPLVATEARLLDHGEDPAESSLFHGFPPALFFPCAGDLNSVIQLYPEDSSETVRKIPATRMFLTKIKDRKLYQTNASRRDSTIV